MNFKFPYRLILVLSVLILSSLCADVQAQANAQNNTDPQEINNDSKREEIQRYFGYELLLYRYLSLPYDVSVNNNQQGNFVDIGILYLLFIPVLILVFARNRRWLYPIILLYLLFTWIISTSNAFLFSSSRGKVLTESQALQNYLKNVSFSDEPFAHMLGYLYKLSLTLYIPFAEIGLGLSGDKDAITYPVIFSLFIVMSLVLSKVLTSFSVKSRYFIIFFWIYSFYWLAFSGGIIWYGYILLLTGLLLIGMLIAKLRDRGDKWGGLLKKAFIVLGSIWATLAIAMRTSDIQPMMDQKYFAKAMFNPVFYDYASGKIDRDQSLDIIYADVSKAFNRINKDTSALVLRVGTSFSYFIDNNHKRIIQDNQLGLFHEIKKRYPDNLQLVDVLKASNIKYIMLDLNTASIDYTPDKSLTMKYREVLGFVLNNPYLKLLATDRVVGNRDASGDIMYSRRMFGEEIFQFGRYAIFEII